VPGRLARCVPDGGSSGFCCCGVTPGQASAVDRELRSRVPALGRGWRVHGRSGRRLRGCEAAHERKIPMRVTCTLTAYNAHLHVLTRSTSPTPASEVTPAKHIQLFGCRGPARHRLLDGGRNLHREHRRDRRGRVSRDRHVHHRHGRIAASHPKIDWGTALGDAAVLADVVAEAVADRRASRVAEGAEAAPVLAPAPPLWCAGRWVSPGQGGRGTGPGVPGPCARWRCRRRSRCGRCARCRRRRRG